MGRHIDNATVDRVAQVLCDGDKAKWDHDPSRQHYRRQALAAVDVMTLAHEVAVVDDEVLARRLVQVVLWMKRQYQDAGLIVAREFCKAKGLDAYAIERTLRQGGG